MKYSKPIVKTIQISAPPLAANFAPPPISVVPVRHELLPSELCNMEADSVSESAKQATDSDHS